MRQLVQEDVVVDPDVRSGVGPVKMYICMRPRPPSVGVEKFALLVPESPGLRR